MAPVRAVRDVRDLAGDCLDGYPVVTHSNRWIEVRCFQSWGGMPRLRQVLRERGYRVVDRLDEFGCLRVTKRGVRWPHQN